MPPEAVDLVSRLLQYSPNLRCTAVSIWVFVFVRVVNYNCCESQLHLCVSCSWMPWPIPSLMNFVTWTPACQMDVSFHLCSTLNLMVWCLVLTYKLFLIKTNALLLSIIRSSNSQFYSCCYPLELKGVPAEILMKLVPEHARKQVPFMASD